MHLPAFAPIINRRDVSEMAVSHGYAALHDAVVLFNLFHIYAIFFFIYRLLQPTPK